MRTFEHKVFAYATKVTLTKKCINGENVLRIEVSDIVLNKIIIEVNKLKELIIDE